MFSRAAACSEKGCRGGQNEDTHIYEKVIFNLNGQEILGEIFGVSRKELIHNNFIAWLLGNQESHNLGNYTFKKFLEILV